MGAHALGKFNKVFEKLSLEEIIFSLPTENIKEFNKPFNTSAFLDRLFLFASLDINEIPKRALKRKSNLSYAAAALASLKLGNWIQSLLLVKEFLNSFEGKALKAGSLIQKVKFSKNDVIESLKYNVADMSSYFYVAVTEIFSGFPENALFFVSLAGNLANELDLDEKIEVRVAESLFYSTLKSRLSPRKWRQTLALLKDVPEWKRIGESRAIVKKISSSQFLANTLVFKESKDIEPLIAEAETANFFNEEMKIKAPIPLYISEEPNDDGFYTYIMTHLNGETFLDYLEKGDKKYTSNIIENLVKIHHSFPKEKVRFGNLDLESALAKRLYNPNIYTSISMEKGYSVLINLFEEHKELWRYNKDAHPENWLITEDEEIMVIDTENNFAMPVFFDLANLFGYGNYFTKEEMREGVNLYYSKLKELEPDLEITHDKFELLFWNALIHRSFFLCSAWSDPERSSLHNKRIYLVDNALMAIDVIKKDYSETYNKNKSSYVALEAGFSALKEHLLL